MLETCVQMRLQSELNDYRIMMTVDVGVHSVESFENLTDQDLESFGKRYASYPSSAS